MFREKPDFETNSISSNLCPSFFQNLSFLSASNSHAGGMAVARPYGFAFDFVRNPFS